MEECVKRLRELDEQGYTVIEHAMPPAIVARLRDELECLYARQAEISGKPWGPERGLENLTNKSLAFLEVIEATCLVRELMETALGPNLVLASLNARSSSPYTPAQGLHRDHQGQLLFEHRPNAGFVP